MDLYPVSVTQLSTVGNIHNYTPVDDIKAQLELAGVPGRDYEITRVYLDGLIFHVHWSSAQFEETSGNSILLGGSDELLISSVSYKNSAQYEKLLIGMYEALIGPLN